KIGLHPELADAFQNGRRQELAELEREFDIRIEVNASPALHRAEEKVEWAYREKPATTPRRQAPARPAISVSDLLPGAEPGIEPASEEEEMDEEEAPYTGPPEGTHRERGEGRGRRQERRGRGQRQGQEPRQRSRQEPRQGQRQERAAAPQPQRMQEAEA